MFPFATPNVQPYPKIPLPRIGTESPTNLIKPIRVGQAKLPVIPTNN